MPPLPPIPTVGWARRWDALQRPPRPRQCANTSGRTGAGRQDAPPLLVASLSFPLLLPSSHGPILALLFSGLFVLGTLQRTNPHSQTKSASRQELLEGEGEEGDAFDDIPGGPGGDEPEN